MTSPVDTSVKLFWSGMANVPVLTGQAGSLIGVLDACLVTGCDIKPLTRLEVVSGVATATFSGQHSARIDSVVLVEGVTGDLAELNGEQKVTARPSANTLTLATGLPDGVAAGAVTLRMAPAGWRKPFGGGNIAAYTSADPHSLGMLLRVNDTGATSARVTGYESMSDINTGTQGFGPNSASGYWNKSYTAAATAIPWMLAADSRMLLLWMAGGVTYNSSYTGGGVYGFGDLISRRPGGDAFAAVLSADSSEGQYSGGLEAGKQNLVQPRAYSGLGAPVWGYSLPYVGGSGSVSGNDSTLGAFPNAVTGELFFSRRYVAAGANSAPRGDVPGLITVPQSGMIDSFNTGNVVTAVGHPLSGRSLFALRIRSGSMTSAPDGVAFIDQTGPWR